MANIFWFTVYKKLSDNSDTVKALLGALCAYVFCFFCLWMLYIFCGIRSAFIKPDSAKFGEDKKGSDNIPGVGGVLYERYVRAHANAYENLPW